MKKNRKLLALALALGLMVSLLAGCGTQTAATPTPTAAAPEAFNLNVCIASEPNTIDPQLNTAVDGATLINHAFEGLMKLDSEGEIVPARAASYSVDDTGTVYTFTLRDDIKWSDGEPVKASDFVYAWQRLVDPATASEYNYMIDMVVNANEIMAGEKDPSELGIVAKDDKTVEITLNNPTAYFLEIAAFPATYPVRKDVIDAKGDQWTFEDYVCNGPYVLTDWSHNEYMLYSKNPEYYGVDSLGPDTIKFYLMDDTNAMLAAFNSGELAFIDDVPTNEIPALKEAGTLTIEGQMGTYFVCFNTEKAPFDDARVRKAFSLVIDRNYIVDQVAQGGQIPASAYVPTGLSDVSPTDDFRAVGGDYYSVKTEDYEANCEQARQLLSEAGYPDGKSFPAVEYMYNTSEGHKAIAEALQNMWQTELGVTVTITNQDWAAFIDTRHNGDFQIARHGWLADYNDPISFLDMWVTGGGNNDANYSNADYDALISAVKTSSDRTERITKMHEAEDILMADMPVAPIYFYTDLYMINPNLQGFYSSPLGDKYFMYTSMAS